MAVAGIEVWLVVRDCQLTSVTDMAVRVAKGVQLTEVRDSVHQRLDCRVEPELAVATERAFEEALEESVQSSSIEGLMADQVREQIQGRHASCGCRACEVREL